MNDGFEGFGFPEEEKSYDKFALGLLAAVIVPVLVLLFLINREAPQLDMNAMIDYAWQMTKRRAFAGYFITSLIPNMFLFMVFYKLEVWKMCRGFVVGTILCFIVYVVRGLV